MDCDYYDYFLSFCVLVCLSYSIALTLNEPNAILNFWFWLSLGHLSAAAFDICGGFSRHWNHSGNIVKFGKYIIVEVNLLKKKKSANNGREV